MSNIIRLENWAVIQFDSSSEKYRAPEQHTLHFKGYCYGDSRRIDGNPVLTTTIVSYKDGVFTTFSGSQYILGEVDKEYENLFPNAFQRIVESVHNEY